MLNFFFCEFLLIHVIVFVKAKLSAGDVIFPNKSPEKNGIEDKKETELYKISHHSYGIGEQLNRKFVLNWFASETSLLIKKII